MDRTDDTRGDRDVRVVIVDDNDLLVDTLVAALQGHPVLRVVATADDGPAGLAAVAEHRPDVALVDLRLGGAWGLALVPAMRTVDPAPAIVVFSAALDEATRRAVAAGEVTSHVSKGVPLDELLDALVAAADHVRSPRS